MVLLFDKATTPWQYRIKLINFLEVCEINAKYKTDESARLFLFDKLYLTLDKFLMFIQLS